MKKEFIKVNLKPRYIPNKYISYIINSVGLVVVTMFVLFYLVYLPYKNATSDLRQAEFDNQMAKNEIAYLEGILKREPLDGADLIYMDTIDYVESTELPLRLRLSELYSSVPAGATMESIYFSLNKEMFKVDVTVDSDETLLVYIETLWKMHWVKNVEFTEAGPGSIALTISIDVGDYNE